MRWKSTQLVEGSETWKQSNSAPRRHPKIKHHIISPHNFSCPHFLSVLCFSPQPLLHSLPPIHPISSIWMQHFNDGSLHVAVNSPPFQTSLSSSQDPAKVDQLFHPAAWAGSKRLKMFECFEYLWIMHPCLHPCCKNYALPHAIACSLEHSSSLHNSTLQPQRWLVLQHEILHLISSKSFHTFPP